MSSADPWSDARARAREEVRAAFAPRRRVCRECGHEEETAARACPRCGTPYVEMQEPGMSPRQRRWLAIGATGVVLVLVAAPLAIVPALKNDKRGSEARARAEDRAALARERQRIALDQRPHSATAKPGASVPAQLEAAITADARSRVRAGSLR